MHIRATNGGPWKCISIWAAGLWKPKVSQPHNVMLHAHAPTHALGALANCSRLTYSKSVSKLAEGQESMQGYSSHSPLAKSCFSRHPMLYKRSSPGAMQSCTSCTTSRFVRLAAQLAMRLMCRLIHIERVSFLPFNWGEAAMHNQGKYTNWFWLVIPAASELL